MHGMIERRLGCTFLMLGILLAPSGGALAATAPSAVHGQDPHLMGDRYQQASAEAMALQIQAYNFATRQLDTLLATHHGPRPPAVVLDLDETVLDNSAYQAAAVRDGFSFPTHWDDWVRAARAPLIPGARAFLEHADARGVAIYYVSNRKQANQTATIANLARWHLPQATAAHVRLKGPPKAQRRSAIAQDHDILLLIGDTLHDFDAEFAGTSLAAQRQAVTRLRGAFGTRFIVMPNAMYGSWSEAQLQAWRPPTDEPAHAGGTAENKLEETIHRHAEDAYAD
ncbi:5'-nucleotidase, lipoprotein e(P4) family [Salinisphaera sp. Q1T1-3]|uniref:5'-nucleotidase, lipoprotein e(P4) family n=1 Tax=Salinisphaera sp. Q1T1-3 TaxID=2321229 RepID=UPI000E75CF8F|nr:5'-nucleotidase, lipoprotein e(P4) family [Salinisphaera sp. Q1T1-3]RJS94849.1 5'-nucleotidase, lipoprotein e(P4) family [Salinisphaera sp. Q1T1-3]